VNKMVKEETAKLKIVSDGKFTKVYTPNGDLIPCLSVKFIHTTTFPRAFLEIYDFELDAEVSEDAVKFIKAHLPEDEEDE
jgi:hypothetical protein